MGFSVYLEQNIKHQVAYCYDICISKGAKIRNRYNQVPHLTQGTNGKVTNSQLDTTNKSQEVSLFPAGDHKAQINRCPQRHNKHKTEKKHNRSTKEDIKLMTFLQGSLTVWALYAYFSDS